MNRRIIQKTVEVFGISIIQNFHKQNKSELCDFCSQQEHFLESFLCKLDPVTNEVFLLIALLCVLEEEKEDENNRFYDRLSHMSDR